MTKHTDDDNASLRDRPIEIIGREKVGEWDSSFPNEARERIHDARRVLMKGAQCLQDRALLKRSWAKQYGDGVLKVAFVFDVKPLPYSEQGRFCAVSDDASRAIRGDKFFVKGTAAGADDNWIAGGDSEGQVSRQQNLVFVCDIEKVQVVKVETTALERLYFIENEALDFLRRPAAVGLSVQHSGNGVFCGAEWKFDMPGELPAVCFDGHPVCMVKSDSQIMDRISDYRGGVFFYRGTKQRYPSVVLGPQSLRIFGDMLSEDGFQLIDVILGPFQF